MAKAKQPTDPSEVMMPANAFAPLAERCFGLLLNATPEENDYIVWLSIITALANGWKYERKPLVLRPMHMGLQVEYHANKEEVTIGMLNIEQDIDTEQGTITPLWKFTGRMPRGQRRTETLDHLLDTIELDCRGLCGMHVLNALR